MQTTPMRPRRIWMLALVSGSAAMMLPRPARAAKAMKGDFAYQDKPKDGKSCASCRLFTADAAQPGMGTCAAIEGVISASGWCMAYSPRA